MQGTSTPNSLAQPGESESKHTSAEESPALVFNEARRLLTELGFKESECSIYFSLLDKPEGSPIDSLLSHSVKPTDDVEQSLRTLVDKGLVRITSNRLEAAEPSQFIAKIREDSRAEMARNLDALSRKAVRLGTILQPHFLEARLGIKPEDLLEPLPSLQEMEVRTVKIISNLTKEACISAETFGWFGKIEEELYRAIERGVKFRVIMTSEDTQPRNLAARLRTLGVSVRRPTEDWYPVRGTLGDKNELVFLIWTAKARNSEKAKYFRPHYTRNLGMIRVFSDAFEQRWNQAVSL